MVKTQGIYEKLTFFILSQVDHDPLLRVNGLKKLTQVSHFLQKIVKKMGEMA